MKLAFCLFNYFPYGGLQRDFLRIARQCQKRGHEIHVFTMKWEGEAEPDFHLHLIPVTAWQNHTRSRLFAEKVKTELQKEQFDLVIGFNKMPYLDVYYAADVCYQSRIHQQRPWFYRLLPRYRQWVALEREIFARGKSVEVMLISPFQPQEYHQFYQTEHERMHLLPPGIAKDRLAPENADEIRQAIRQANHLSENDNILLMVGSGFKTKGVDRAIQSLAALPSDLKKRSQLWIIGKDNPRVFQHLAKRLQVLDRVRFLGARDDVPAHLLAADFLVHPAYHENTGTVLLEALASGLPVLTVASCGYAPYITQAKAGVVLPTPFQQEAWNQALHAMLLSDQKLTWRRNASAFAKEADIYHLPKKAAEFIENVGQKRVSAS